MKYQCPHFPLSLSRKSVQLHLQSWKHNLIFPDVTYLILAEKYISWYKLVFIRPKLEEARQVDKKVELSNVDRVVDILPPVKGWKVVLVRACRFKPSSKRPNKSHLLVTLLTHSLTSLQLKVKTRQVSHIKFCAANLNKHYL